MSVPITPKQVRHRRKNRKLSDKEIDAINELIVNYWDGEKSRVPWVSLLARALEDREVDPLDIDREYELYGWECSPVFGLPDQNSLRLTPAAIVFEPKKGV